MKKSTHSSEKDNKFLDQQKHSLKEDFSSLKENFQSILQDLKSSGSELLNEGQQDVRERLEKVMSKITELGNQVSADTTKEFFDQHLTEIKEKAHEYTIDLENKIKRHPIASLVVSFGIGLMLARVLISWPYSR